MATTRVAEKIKVLASKEAWPAWVLVLYPVLTKLYNAIDLMGNLEWVWQHPWVWDAILIGSGVVWLTVLVTHRTSGGVGAQTNTTALSEISWRAVLLLVILLLVAIPVIQFLSQSFITGQKIPQASISDKEKFDRSKLKDVVHAWLKQADYTVIEGRNRPGETFRFSPFNKDLAFNVFALENENDNIYLEVSIPITNAFNKVPGGLSEKDKKRFLSKLDLELLRYGMINHDLDSSGNLVLRDIVDVDDNLIYKTFLRRIHLVRGARYLVHDLVNLEFGDKMIMR